LDYQLEAILFTAAGPLSAARLSTITGRTKAEVTAALELVSARLTGGIHLAHTAGTYRLVTSPDTAAVVGAFLDDTQAQDLSRPALETLAIIAYKGPLTKAAIEEVRGVASEAMLRGLTARGLVETAGTSPEPGRPPLYTVSHAFLQHFGLTDHSQLPPLPEEGQ
jgi:segregation and condensation protein B